MLDDAFQNGSGAAKLITSSDSSQILKAAPTPAPAKFWKQLRNRVRLHRKWPAPQPWLQQHTLMRFCKFSYSTKLLETICWFYMYLMCLLSHIKLLFKQKLLCPNFRQTKACGSATLHPQLQHHCLAQLQYWLQKAYCRSYYVSWRFWRAFAQERFTSKWRHWSKVGPWNYPCSGNLETLYESGKEVCNATQNLSTFSWDMQWRNWRGVRGARRPPWQAKCKKWAPC